MSKLKILFLCTGNSCRSQMAEGWARSLLGQTVEPSSAGIEAHGLNPRAVAVMREAGVDIQGQQSQTVDELETGDFDYVVTVCGHADERCPAFPGKTKVIHVGLALAEAAGRDCEAIGRALAASAKTEEEALMHYRRVRDEIRRFVEKLPGGLGGRG